MFVLVLALFAGLPGLGLNPEDLDTVPGVVRVELVPVAPGRPSADSLVRVDHSPDMPPVGNQGGQASCVAWAHGYYHMTHNEFLERGWDVRDPRHQFSPAFLYNQVNSGRDWGTSGSVVMRLALEQGCASLADHPYDQRDHTTWPSEAAFFNALEFRGEEACFIPAGDAAGINRVRQHLANGFTCVIGIQVWENFDRIREFNNTYCSSERFGSMRGWHAVTIVGYDDTLSTADGPGAFRVANSWGTGWGDAGWFWMSYVAVMDEEMSGRQVEYIRDRTGYRPELVARVTIRHATRDRVGIEIGVGPSFPPPWSFRFRAWRVSVIDHPFPEHAIVFDISEGAEFLSGSGSDLLYLGVADDTRNGEAGWINGFAVEHLAWETRGVSLDPPVAIPDGGGPVYALAQLPSRSALADRPAPRPGRRPATVVRRTLYLEPTASRPGLYSRSGQRVMALAGGENDLSGLGPGVYFIRSQAPGDRGFAAPTAKVIITR